MDYRIVKKQASKTLAALIILAAISSCTSNSNTFDKSPCACDFKPANTGNYKEDNGHA